MTEPKQSFAPRTPTFGVSILVLLICIATLTVGIILLKQPPNVPLILCGLVMGGYGVALGIPWSDLMDSAWDSIRSSLEAVMIVMIIGMVVGSWIAAGTVPYIIFWGLRLFRPEWILPFTVIFCAVLSTLTGSSWTTAGTIGIAFLGIGLSMGIPGPILAGAICCGAFFGDAESPLSDGFNFATAVSESGLYNGVKGTVVSLLPALLLSAVLMGFIGSGYRADPEDVVQSAQIAQTLQGLDAGFNLSPLTLLPAVVLLILLVVKAPAIPSMLAAAASGVLVDVVVQGATLQEALSYLMTGYVGHTGVESVDAIISRGGMTSMMDTVAIMILSMWMAGIMLRTGIVPVVLGKISDLVTRVTPLVALTNFLTLAFSYFAADCYLAMALPSKALGGAYDALGLDRNVLCRSTVNGVVFAPMVPWGTSGVYIAGTLGIATTSYLPYYFLGIMSPLCAIAFAALGIGTFKAKQGSAPRKR